VKGRFLDVDLTGEEIARAARFLRRKAEQTNLKAMTLHRAAGRVSTETRSFAIAARRTASRWAARRAQRWTS
jgi:hypothetical protein